MSVESDFSENRESLEVFFEYLQSIDPKLDQNDSNNAEKLFAIQKSSFILMLYNIIESTVTGLILKIFNLIVTYSPMVEFKDFDIEIRKLWIKLQTQSFSDVSKKDRGNKLADLYESLYVPTDWKIYNIFSNSKKIEEALDTGGNLDFEKIQKIFNDFNIKITPNATQENPKKDSMSPVSYKSGDLKAIKYRLKKIKDLRNKLAHGNVSFLQGASDKTIGNLEEYKDTTIECLEILINKTNNYCNILQKNLEEKINNKQSVTDHAVPTSNESDGNN